MSKSRRWSNRSPVCRIDLRPSRVLAACLAALGALGTISWWMSEATTSLAVGGSALWLVAAIAYAVREMRRPARSLAIGADGAEVDERRVDDFTVDWRGPIFVLEWREAGRHVRWLGFPDVLDATARRELRLWALQRREYAPTAAVAP